MGERVRKKLELTPKNGQKKLEFSYFWLELDNGSTASINSLSTSGGLEVFLFLLKTDEPFSSNLFIRQACKV